MAFKSGFVNTVFSFMRMKKGRDYRTIRQLKRRMLEEFPAFRNNKTYGRYMDKEQIAYIELMMRNSFVFYWKYRLVWFVRGVKMKFRD